jgi:hypothetical protein
MAIMKNRQSIDGWMDGWMDDGWIGNTFPFGLQFLTTRVV